VRTKVRAIDSIVCTRPAREVRLTAKVAAKARTALPQEPCQVQAFAVRVKQGGAVLRADGGEALQEHRQGLVGRDHLLNPLFHQATQTAGGVLGAAPVDRLRRL
jgi:hypothetical protein